MFPVGGGRVLAQQSDDFQNARTDIGFHDQAFPVVSKLKICICVDSIPLSSDYIHATAVVKKTHVKREVEIDASIILYFK